MPPPIPTPALCCPPSPWASPVRAAVAAPPRLTGPANSWNVRASSPAGRSSRRMLTRRSLLRGILYLAVMSCVVALLVELCFRFYLFGFAALSYDRVDSVIGIGRDGVLRTADYRDIVYELQPN